MPPGKHSRLGGSKAKRWRNCPGSVAMEDGIPSESNEHTSLGTAAHELAEVCLVEGQRPHNYIGDTFDGQDGRVHVVDQEMADAVLEYTEFCEELIHQAQERDGEVWVEKRFDLKPLNPPEPMFGTADFVAWLPRHESDLSVLHVVDYKNGVGVEVLAGGNDQLLMYIGGALLETGKMPDIIRATIVQPRHHHYDGPRTWEMTTEEFSERFRALMADARRASEDDGTSLEPGDWCQFCKARPHCPAHMKLAEVTTQMAFEVLEPEEERKLPAPTRLTKDQHLAILEVADQIEDWIHAVREHVHEALEAGEEYEGWALAEKRAYRKWEDEDALLEYLKRKRIPKKVYEVRKLPSPAQLERALKTRDEDFPDHLVVKQSSGTKLVRADSGAKLVDPPVYRFFEPQS